MTRPVVVEPEGVPQMTIAAVPPLHHVDQQDRAARRHLVTVRPLAPAPARPPTEVEHDRDVRRRSTSALLAFAHGLPDEDARHRVLARVIDTNLPVAEAIAARYRRRGVAPEDLQQAAYEGLCKAVRRFDPDHSDDLLTFAVPTIRGEVQRHFRDHSWVVRPPRRLQELSGRARQLSEELEQELGREPSVEELAERLEVDAETCGQALVASEAMHSASLDQPVSRESSLTIADLVGQRDRLDLVEDAVVLRPLISALGPREQRILHLRFVEERTQAEIGEELGVTQTQVSRLLRGILADLRRALETGDAAAEAEPLCPTG